MQSLSASRQPSPLAVPDATLVVVHMQPQGFAYAQWVLKPVLSLVDRFMSDGHGIVLVKFRETVDEAIIGPTAKEIEGRLLGYTRLGRADETAEDASQEVLQACKHAGLSTGRLVLCGVTTDDCVAKTTHGLAAELRNSRIEVAKDACMCWQPNYDWSKFAQLPNVFPV